MTSATESPLPQEAKDDQDWSTVGMLKVCLALFLGLTAIFVPFSEIDLYVASLFYFGDNEFWLSKSAFTAAKNDYIRPAVGVIAVSGLVYYIYERLTARPQKVKKLARWGFLLVCFTLANGLLVHAILKDNFGRARPSHVVEFEGTKQFTPALLPAQQCPRNCSFVSGDAAVGFVFIALALYARRYRKQWILVTISTGLGLGLLRIMNGSHFISDILYAGVFTCGTVLLLYRWIVEERWNHDTRWLRPMFYRLAGWSALLLPKSISRRFLRARVRIRCIARKLS